MPSLITTLGIIGGTSAIAYGLAKLLLGTVDDTLIRCNDNIQGFDLHGTSIYWRVFEGTCRANDINYDKIRYVIENLLEKMRNQDHEWPSSQCEYGTVLSDSYVWSYGTDYYEVEETDCLEPLRELQKEKEENLDLGEYLKGMIKDQKQDIVGQVINNFL